MVSRIAAALLLLQEGTESNPGSLASKIAAISESTRDYAWGARDEWNPPQRLYPLTEDRAMQRSTQEEELMARLRATSDRVAARFAANTASETVWLLNPERSAEDGAAPTSLVRDLPEGADVWARGRLWVEKSTHREAEGESSSSRIELSFELIEYGRFRILLEGPDFLGEQLLDWHESGMDMPLSVDAITVSTDDPIPHHLRPTDDSPGWDRSNTYSWEMTGTPSPGDVGRAD